MEPRGLEQNWFELRHPEPGVVTITEPLHEEQVKSYLVVGSTRAALIDTGMGVGDIRTLVRGLTDLPITVVQSHAHWDHIGGTHRFTGDAEIWIHEAEAVDLAGGIGNDRMRSFLAVGRLLGPLPVGVDSQTVSIPGVRATRWLRGGEVLALGDRTLEVIHAPGHSPGGIVLLDRLNGILFSTDVAYPGALYAQLRHSDLCVYRQTMMTLATLAPALRTVYPAHDTSPMNPTLLPVMASALDAIIDGRRPDDERDGVARHQFETFSVLVRAGEHRPC